MKNFIFIYAFLAAATTLPVEANSSCVSLESRIGALMSPAEGVFRKKNGGKRLGQGNCFAPSEKVVDLGLIPYRAARPDINIATVDSDILENGELALECPSMEIELNPVSLPLAKSTKTFRYEETTGYTFSFFKGKLLTEEERYSLAERGEKFCEMEFTLESPKDKVKSWRLPARGKGKIDKSGGGNPFYSSDENSRKSKIAEKWGYQYELLASVPIFGESAEDDGSSYDFKCLFPTKDSRGDGEYNNSVSVGDILNHFILEGKPLIKKIKTNYSAWTELGSTPKKVLPGKPADYVKDPFCKKDKEKKRPEKFLSTRTPGKNVTCLLTQ